MCVWSDLGDIIFHQRFFFFSINLAVDSALLFQCQTPHVFDCKILLNNIRTRWTPGGRAVVLIRSLGVSLFSCRVNGRPKAHNASRAVGAAHYGPRRRRDPVIAIKSRSACAFVCVFVCAVSLTDNKDLKSDSWTAIFGLDIKIITLFLVQQPTCDGSSLRIQCVRQQVSFLCLGIFFRSGTSRYCLSFP